MNTLFLKIYSSCLIHTQMTESEVEDTYNQLFSSLIVFELYVKNIIIKGFTYNNLDK